MMLFGRKIREDKNERDKSAERKPMSLQKDTSAPLTKHVTFSETVHPYDSRQHSLHKSGSIGGNFGGSFAQPVPNAVNSIIEGYVVSLTGTNDGLNLWLMNLSQLPGEQKRFLTVLQGSTFFINYAQGDYPSRIDITVSELAGTANEEMNPSHSIATLTPKGPAVAVANPGGIIGYNIQYGLLSSTARSFDISNIPQLTFGATVGDERTPASYPLMEAIVLDLQLTRVVR